MLDDISSALFETNGAFFCTDSDIDYYLLHQYYGSSRYRTFVHSFCNHKAVSFFIWSNWFLVHVLGES